MLVDSHCHIDFDEYSGRIPQILEGMARNQVTHALCASVNLVDFPRVLALAERHPQLFASVGVHPDHDKRASLTTRDLVERALHPKVVAIGETGLDYFRLVEPRTVFNQKIRDAFNVFFNWFTGDCTLKI